MSPGLAAEIFAVSIGVGILGALLGLGGGILVVPLLTLYMGVPIGQAAGASLVATIATSSGAAAVLLKNGMTNIRLGMFLNLATTAGSLAGALLAVYFSSGWLMLIFGLLLLYSAFAMFRKRGSELPEGVVEHPLAARVGLSGQYYDRSLGRVVQYKVAGVLAGFGVMFGAGLMSGLLGIGSGALKVLGMDVCMRLPWKVSTATSNFMIGVTAAAGVGVYLAQGKIHPPTAAPVALGVLVGALVGSRLVPVFKSGTLRTIFVPVLMVMGAQMIWRGVF